MPEDPSAHFLSLSTRDWMVWAAEHAGRVAEGGVLYYALGGGLGHLTRGLAIARQFRRLRPEPFLILTNSPFAGARLSSGLAQPEGCAAGTSSTVRHDVDPHGRAALPGTRGAEASALLPGQAPGGAAAAQGHRAFAEEQRGPSGPRGVGRQPAGARVRLEARCHDLPACTVLHVADQPGPAELAALVRALAGALRPAVLAVDAFPAGILGELPEVLVSLPCRRVAVLRRLQQRWVERWRLRDVLVSYDAVALVEPGAAFPGLPAGLRCIETPPVLIRDAGELLPPADARRRLGADGAAPLVLLVATSARPEEQALPSVVRRVVDAVSGGQAQLRVAAPFATTPAEGRVSHFPLLEWLPGVDLVVGACGYNLCHEAEAAGVPAVFVPQPRLYDDQSGRAAGRTAAHSPQELEQCIREALAAQGHGRSAPAYANGAADVAHLLAELTSR